MFNLEIINHGSPVEDSIELINIVSKPVERLSYSKYITDKAIPISYIESEIVTPQDNLNISDLSWSIPENNPNLLKYREDSFSSSSKFVSTFRRVLFTNVTYTNKLSEIEPLFYKHKRDVKEAIVYFVSKGDRFDLEYGYKIQNNKLYTNYKNTYLNESGKYRVYFVSGVDTQGNSFNELLNVEEAIKEASWEDIDPETGEFINQIYTVEKEANRYIFDFTKDDFCSNSTIYFKLLNQNLIKLLKPRDLDTSSPWTLEVSNGEFFSKGRKYFLPEYDAQPFVNEFGLLRATNQTCYQVTKNVIKLSKSKVKAKSSESLDLEIIVLDSEENPIRCITSNVSKIGDKYSDTNLVWESGIVSTDERYGFVELDFSLTPTQIVKANFYYYSDSFLIRDISFNPFENKKVLNKKYYFYLKPNQSYKALEYLICDEDDIIEDCSQVDLKLEVNGSFNTNTVIGGDLESFRQTFCYSGVNENLYLELGEVTFEEDFFLDEILEIDCRRDKEVVNSRYKDIINRQWKILQSKYGYGDLGQVYQNNNIFYIEVPLSLIKDNTNTSKDIERSIRRHLPADMDVIIDYTYPESSIDFNVSQNGEVKLNLSWEEPGTYEIYKSKNKINKELVQTIVSSLEEELSFTDTNVVSGDRYYYWVKINNHPHGNTYGVKIR